MVTYDSNWFSIGKFVANRLSSVWQGTILVKQRDNISFDSAMFDIRKIERKDIL